MAHGLAMRRTSSSSRGEHGFFLETPDAASFLALPVSSHDGPSRKFLTGVQTCCSFRVGSSAGRAACRCVRSSSLGTFTLTARPSEVSLYFLGHIRNRSGAWFRCGIRVPDGCHRRVSPARPATSLDRAKVRFAVRCTAPAPRPRTGPGHAQMMFRRFQRRFDLRVRPHSRLHESRGRTCARGGSDSA